MMSEDFIKNTLCNIGDSHLHVFLIEQIIDLVRLSFKSECSLAIWSVRLQRAVSCVICSIWRWWHWHVTERVFGNWKWRPSMRHTWKSVLRSLTFFCLFKKGREIRMKLIWRELCILSATSASVKKTHTVKRNEGSRCVCTRFLITLIL